MSKIIPKIENDDSEQDIVDISVANSLTDLVYYFTKITEFKERTLNNISLLQVNPFLRSLLNYRIKNMKHVKRKYVKELLLYVKYLTSYNAEKKSLKRAIYDKMLGRNNDLGMRF